MSGLGRRTHYRKHLTDSVLYDFPEPASNECIAKVISTRGSNQFDVQLAKEKSQIRRIDDEIEQNDDISTPNSLVVLAILPTKFRKLIWLKRNDYVIVQYAKDIDDDDNDLSDEKVEDKEKISMSNECIDSNGTNDDRDTATIKSVSTTAMNGGGIRYMITHILYKDQIQHLISNELWPSHDLNFDVSSSNDDHRNKNEPTSDGIVYNTANFNQNNDDYDSYDEYGRKGDEYDDDAGDDDASDLDENNDDDLFVNTNRMSKIVLDDSSSDENE
jgi:probable RNA-binding protein EIF1AD